MLTSLSKTEGQEVGPSAAYIVGFDQLFFKTHETDVYILQFRVTCCWNMGMQKPKIGEFWTRESNRPEEEISARLVMAD